MSTESRDGAAGAAEILDGNEAVARTAYRMSEVIAIYPITPASGMAELCDQWASEHRGNLWGTVPDVIEMQSEAGAAGTLHGAAMRGALATTFTASQGLLLMMPNMFKLAGELTPTVIHVAARAVATHALSIFGDHSDVMAVRSTGFAMLSAGSVQEAADMALIAHAATLRSRVPFLNFFDGFRTSHEVSTVAIPSDDDVRALIDEDTIAALRRRGLDPDHPTLRGTAQNPDVFFQAREAINPYIDAVPGIVEELLGRLSLRTGRRYGLVDYYGAPDAERVIVVMGSGVGAISEAVDALRALGEKVGVLQVRLYRPFPAEALRAALPKTAARVAVLDRTKEPGASGDPLFLDVLCALNEGGDDVAAPEVIGGRYGLASKEFTPAMVKAVFDNLALHKPKRRFTVGIVDDVSNSSLVLDSTFVTDDADLRAVFFGLGSDGTVGANKSTAKIAGDALGGYAQGYFVYDSKKSGSMTVSHLRFSDRPVRSTYLVSNAHLVACHQIGLLHRVDVLAAARPGGVFLLNSPFAPERTWDQLPREAQRHIIDKNLRVHIIDAHRLASEVGLPGLISTVMQAAFFLVSDLLPASGALEALRASVQKTYALLGPRVVEANLAAIDGVVGRLSELTVPVFSGAAALTGALRRPAVPVEAADFVQRVTARMLVGEGDLLPVSAMPIDGTFPTGTARVEKRRLTTELPVWDPEICIDCARCTLVCPHAAIRMKVHGPAAVIGAPDGFASKAFRSHEHPGLHLTIQVAPEDCTGCGVCVDVCPARSKSQVKHKALNMEPAAARLTSEMDNWAYFLAMDSVEPGLLDPTTVKGAQSLEPLFEFSGACSGCGETPYLKLLSQLFGDRSVIANATGCSSIYGGNLPTTPWAVNAEGRGPAWANSLFEDNAEFGLGMRIALDRQREVAVVALGRLATLADLPGALVRALLSIDPALPVTHAEITAQRTLVAQLDETLRHYSTRADEVGRVAKWLLPLTGTLVRRNVWIVGGDGWAYDIGSGGLDHVLGSGRDVNILVLDTEVYSNTGGQASKATPRGAVAKFAAGGKRTAKKDLGVEARRYGNVYVAQIAIGANDVQAVKAFAEAEAWPGPSLIIAYSTCIAHGIEMRTSMSHQKDAVKSGYWPLYRYKPGGDEHLTPFQLDSKAPSIPVDVFMGAETRFATLRRSDPDAATELTALAQRDIDERWRYYDQLAHVERTVPGAFGEQRTADAGHGDGPDGN